MNGVLNILCAIIIIICAFNSEAEEFKRFLLHPEIDTTQVNFIINNDEFVDIYTKIAGYRFDKNFHLINKFLQIDTLTTQPVQIRSVDYLNDKIFVGTSAVGLIVLDSNLKVIKNYLRENSKLEYSKTCGTYYDSISMKYFSLNCGFGLFEIDQNQKEEYIWKGKPFESAFIWSFNIINNNYYIGYETYDYNKLEFVKNTGIFDRDFKLIHSFDFTKDIGLIDNMSLRTKEFENYIGFITNSQEFVILNTSNNQYKILASSLENKLDWIVNNKKIDEEIYYFGRDGLFSYNLATEVNIKIPLNDEINIKGSSEIHDIVKIGNRFLVGSGYGLYSKEINISDVNEFSEDEVNVIDDILKIGYKINSVEIFNNLGTRLIGITARNDINLNQYISSNGVYFIKLTSVSGKNKILKHLVNN